VIFDFLFAIEPVTLVLVILLSSAVSLATAVSKLLISSVLSARLPILALILSVVVVTQSFCPMNTVLSKD